MRRKLNLVFAALALVLGIAWASHGVAAQAATTITIDGEFSDWDAVPKTTTSSKAQVAMVVSNQTLYYYMAMNPSGIESALSNGWASGSDVTSEALQLRAGNQTFSLPLTADMGTYAPPTKVGTKEKVWVNVGWNTSQSAGTEGYVVAVKSDSAAGYQDVFEGSVDLSLFGLSDNVTKFKLSGGSYNLGQYEVTATKGALTEASSSSSSSASTDAGHRYDGHPEIVIDGAFHDWDDVTKTTGEIYGSTGALAMLQFDGNLYIYVQMPKSQLNQLGWANRIQPYGYLLTIGTKKYDLTLRAADASTYRDLTQLNETEKVVMGFWPRGADYTEEQKLPAGATGYASIVPTAAGDGANQTFEVKIPLKAFGVGEDSQVITLSNSNLPGLSTTITGAGTNPVLLASVGLGIALLGLWQFKRRQRQHEVDL
ncbi:Firmicu-CTERM sorting domain-containing protein [Lapidilactobacillus achengensis]|uniref:Firmicu-CTERM sorting domain-containing protein n=1 Tax=Lapidilactobacillus achengensis TaxID=2486000 RepID=A0ABW1UP47_9LACO|nr:Firmicu-CTERM sorting domain-containing protein [Lapidilactobacillus achengensis]